MYIGPWPEQHLAQLLAKATQPHQDALSASSGGRGTRCSRRSFPDSVGSTSVAGSEDARVPANEEAGTPTSWRSDDGSTANTEVMWQPTPCHRVDVVSAEVATYTSHARRFNLGPQELQGVHRSWSQGAHRAAKASRLPPLPATIGQHNQQQPQVLVRAPRQRRYSRQLEPSPAASSSTRPRASSHPPSSTSTSPSAPRWSKPAAQTHLIDGSQLSGASPQKARVDPRAGWEEVGTSSAFGAGDGPVAPATPPKAPPLPTPGRRSPPAVDGIRSGTCHLRATPRGGFEASLPPAPMGLPQTPPWKRAEVAASAKPTWLCDLRSQVEQTRRLFAEEQHEQSRDMSAGEDEEEGLEDKKVSNLQAAAMSMAASTKQMEKEEKQQEARAEVSAPTHVVAAQAAVTCRREAQPKAGASPKADGGFEHKTVLDVDALDDDGIVAWSQGLNMEDLDGAEDDLLQALANVM